MATKRKDNLLKSINTLQDSSQVDDDLEYIKGDAIDVLISGIPSFNRAVELDLLDPHPNNVFNMLEDTEYETLKSSIKEYGIINPILCYADKDRYIILSGHRRAKAAKDIGLKFVPVKIIQPFEDKVKELTLLGTENMSSRKQNPIDIALFIQTLWDEIEATDGKRKRDVISENLPDAIHMSPRSVQNYMLLLSLPDEMQDWIRHGYLSQRSALSILSKLKGTEFEEKAFAEIVKTGEAIIQESSDPANKLTVNINAIINKYTKKEAPTHVRNEVSKLMPKIKALLDSNYSFPTWPSKKKETIDNIQSCIDMLEELKKSCEKDLMQ